MMSEFLGDVKMSDKYTAKVYYGNEEFIEKSSDDVEMLNEWMLVQANGKFGDIHGEIIDNHTQKVVNKFRKSPPD
jgi:hypothetical protein